MYGELTAKILLSLYETGNNPLFLALLLVIIVDIFTGFSKALIEKKLNSSIGLKGLVKHINIVLLSIIGLSLFNFLGIDGFKESIIVFLILQYVISIIENISHYGIRLPRWITEFIDRAYNSYDEKGDE